MAVSRFADTIPFMHSILILDYLKKHGQQLEADIAQAIGLPLSDVQLALATLSTQGQVSRCTVTRFIEGNRIDGVIYRPLGYIPPKAPGRKPGDK